MTSKNLHLSWLTLYNLELQMELIIKYLTLSLRPKTLYMDYVKCLGLFAAFFITIANLPQTYKIIRTKSVKDISTMTYIFLVIGNLAWLIYGIIKKDMPLIVGNSISTLTCLAILLLKIFSKGTKKAGS